MKFKLVIVTTVLMALCGCAGRDPQPVAVVQPGDKDHDCLAIQTEVLANNKTVQNLASEEGGKVAQNVAAGVAGLFIWPLWFAMDFKGAANKEEDALQSRQQYLTVLASQKNCGAAPLRPSVASTSPPIARALVAPASYPVTQ